MDRDRLRSAPTGARLDAMIAAAEADTVGLKREMGSLSLAALGIATILGAGIFVLSGNAASQFAGPGVVLSFAVAGIAAAFSALCYAELVSMIPVSGSTYVFAYASFGNFLAWVIGWDLLLEYLLGGSAIAAGWSGYFGNVLGHLGIVLPDAITGGPFGGGGVINLPAALIVVTVTAVVATGARESARATRWLVALKLSVLTLFVVVGIFYISSSNLVPFVPRNTGHFGAYGWSGVVRAAAVVFFAYIGFDVVCTATQEARNPRRTVPVGLFAALIVTTLLYIAVAFVMTGLISYRRLESPDALSIALGAHPGLAWLQTTVDVGAMIALAATVLATIFAQTRIFMKMAQDGMLPPAFGRIDPASGTPRLTTIVCGAGAAVISGLVPLSTLGDLVSAGTMLAFIIVSIAVLVLRRMRPDLPRPFRLPFGPTIPALSAVVSLGVLLTLPIETLLRVVVWLVIGLGVYFGYGRSRARAVDAVRAAEAAA